MAPRTPPCSTSPFGRAEAEGRLPFELPRSMAAVAASRPDVPDNTLDPVFRYGHGIALKGQFGCPLW